LTGVAAPSPTSEQNNTKEAKARETTKRKRWKGKFLLQKYHGEWL